jgi:dUTP pyrophosphatase
MKVFLEPIAREFPPTRAHKTDAGLDLCCLIDTTVPARGCAVFRTGVHIELPQNTYGKLESKSGLNVAHDIVCCGGTIDEGYAGEILVKLYNLGDTPYDVFRGDKICQLIVQPCLYEDVEVVEDINMNTPRGTNGFGSTGR